MRTAVLASCLVLLAGVARADSLYVRFVGRYDMPMTAYSVDASGDLAYVADDDALRVISVADPAHPVEVGHCDALGWARGVAVSGDYAYVADCDSSLRVISVADPAHPVEVGRCRTSDMAVAVVVSGEYAYVGDRTGLRVISVADPARPVEVGYCHTDYPNDMAVSGGHVYVAASGGGLLIISVADPARPTLVGYYYTSGGVQAVAVSEGYAYVASTDSTFRVISVTDPTNPVAVGYCWTPFAPQDVAVIGSYAFVATWGGGLRVVEIADPAHPVEVGYYRFGQSWSVALDRDYVYFTVNKSLVILQFYQLGDLDVDNDSLDVVADTIRLSVGDCPRTGTVPKTDAGYALGEFVLSNTSASYNPDTTDGPSRSPVDSLSFAGSLTGPGGTLDSVIIPNLPSSLAQGQTIICTLAVYAPPGMRNGDYTGSITITGKDTAGLLVEETFCALIKNKLGDIDIDPDLLDVIADTIRARPRQVSPGPPQEHTEYALGEFILANTSESYNPDSADGPSLSPVDSLSFTGSLAGPGGTLDSILIRNLPGSLAQGQTIACTLAVFVPVGLPNGDYSGPIVITGYDSLHYEIAETVYALVRKLGDLDIDGDSLDVVHDTMNVSVQPVYMPSGMARFMLVNTSSSYNPDAEDGPSQSTLREVEVEAKVEAQGRSIDSIYVLNLPESLAVGQAVECTLALVIPVGESLDGYAGWVTISALDSLGFSVQDSFFLTVHGPQPRQNLDSLRVAPIPFKPNQNPEHDAIHFQGLTTGARVTVYDASGQSVWSATEKGDGHLKWEAKVASGIYVYLVVAKDGQSRAGKLSVIR
jgi:hypothetical protein